MKLQNRLALSYTAAFASLLGVTFAAIFYISKANRLTDFHHHFKDRTLISFRLLIDLHNLNDGVLENMDKTVVNELRENTFLFDSAGILMYSSTGSNATPYVAKLLQKIVSDNKDELFMTTPHGELLGLRITVRDKTYIGIATADNKFGNERMRFMAVLLWMSFLVCLGMLVGLSFYLSGSIIAPIAKLAQEIENISPGRLSTRVSHKEGKGEVAILTAKFNEMLEKVEHAFKFERRFISHLSHELKTPLAIMMAKTEAALMEKDAGEWKKCLLFQRGAILGLSDIIDIVLELSKRENEAGAYTDVVRIDEILFECFDEILLLHKNAQFNFKIEQFMQMSDNLVIKGNDRMLKLAFYNLLRNAVNYSTNNVVKIWLQSTEQSIQLSFINDGLTLGKDESKHLFSYPFRGASSGKVTGFGLGLSLTHRIIDMHNGTLDYRVTNEGENCFDLKFGGNIPKSR